MRFHGVSLAVAVLGVPITALAQPFHGLYIGAGAGYTVTQWVRTTPGTFGANSLRLNENGGVGSLGFGNGCGLRLKAIYVATDCAI
jgi:hypothetical protein